MSTPQVQHLRNEGADKEFQRRQALRGVGVAHRACRHFLEAGARPRYRLECAQRPKKHARRRSKAEAEEAM